MRNTIFILVFSRRRNLQCLKRAWNFLSQYSTSWNSTFFYVLNSYKSANKLAIGLLSLKIHSLRNRFLLTTTILLSQSHLRHFHTDISNIEDNETAGYETRISFRQVNCFTKQTPIPENLTCEDKPQLYFPDTKFRLPNKTSYKMLCCNTVP